MAPTGIHLTANISKKTQLGRDLSIGPGVVIGDDVTVGDNCRIGPFTVITGPTVIGENNRFFGQASIGSDPQDLKFKGETSFLFLGDDNLIREFVTINRGTAGGGGKTVIGSGNLIMTGAHVAHDCIIGDRTILENAATLAGHVLIGDHAIVGAFSGVHQFCRVGAYAFIGGYTVVTRDAVPFVKTVGIRSTARTFGINAIGLERRGFSEDRIEALRKAYRLIFKKKLKLKEAISRVREEITLTEDVETMLQFLESSERGFIR